MNPETLLGDPVFRAIVDRFVAELPQRVAAIRAAASDWEDAQRLAHQLKGAGGGFGFPGLTAPAARVEQAAADKDRKRFEDAVRQLEAACDEAVSAWTAQPVG